ncbi:unnamed protein product [Dracunculus medinensis]|uniref:MARVEL domain-containing protein n=1 Tax=Dracunculus medinensis TaxID=318479 RepID=A0A0N4UBI4_DRAME|nr:unnamed protein product [Dracunculus medinensis]
MDAILGVRMGLEHMNVTLKSKSSTSPANDMHKRSLLNDLEYNERFEFLNVYSMEKELMKSLQKGLPYPIIKVIEYLSVDRAGFTWGRQYRLAGYYTLCLLWTSFIVWIIKMVILCLVPHHFCKLVLSVGVLILSSDIVYIIFVPKHLHIPFPSPDGSLAILDFRLSFCFYMTFLAGFLSIIVGVVLCYLQSASIYTLQTFLSCNIDEYSCSFRRDSSPEVKKMDSIEYSNTLMERF